MGTVFCLMDDMDLEREIMEVYLGPQLPREREAVGLLPRVSFRSCSVTDFGIGSLSRSIN